jgi:O-antigen ligase
VTSWRDIAAGAALGVVLGVVAAGFAGSWAIAAIAAGAVGIVGALWIVARPSRWIFAFLAAILLLPPIPFPWGDSGVHAGILIAALGVWGGILRLRQWRLRFHLLAVGLVGFTIALLASVPWAAWYSGASVAAGSLARVGLFATGVYLFLDLGWGPARHIREARLVRFLFWTGSASACLAVIDFVFQLPAPARFAEQFVWLSSGVFRRAQGVFYEASTLGCFCAFLLVMLAAATVTGVRAQLRIRGIWMAAAAIFALAALIFSFSRAAAANVIVSLAALVLLERRRVRMRLPLAASAAAMAALMLAGILFPEFASAYLMKLHHSAEYFVAEPNLVLSNRIESWAALADYIGEHPWNSVLGIGYKTLPYTTHLGRPVIADNMYLSLLIESGWPGLAALLALSAAILAVSYRQARTAATPVRRFCGTWMFAFWCGEMVQMASGDILTYWRVLPAFFAVLAIAARDENPDPGPVL